MSEFFGYIWRNSRGGQVRILAVVLLSFPFYYFSLDLPKYIVSDVLQGRAFAGGRTTAPLFRFDVALPGWLGGMQLASFEGFTLGRIDYLFALSGLFLLLVLINGSFKYVINMRKGALGERLLQQLRFDLFSSLLQLTPEAARHVKPSEAASIIKDEVEPIGGFVGDAFVQPIFLGGQVLTALGFILLQNLSLGLIPPPSSWHKPSSSRACAASRCGWAESASLPRARLPARSARSSMPWEKLATTVPMPLSAASSRTGSRGCFTSVTSFTGASSRSSRSTTCWRRPRPSSSMQSAATTL